MSTNEKLAPGMVLGRYELLLPIAQGGMATVWAARQKGSRGFQKTVAIKTMLPTLSDDPQFEQMFLDEAALAARIHHPHVVEILDLGEQDDVLYLVMEWIDGEALSVVAKAVRKNNANLPTRIALRIAMQAAAGLHAAHELRDENDAPLQLVHRDVSPQNILVTYDGVVKLVDFGVAKAVNRSGGETTAGQLKGKIPYMSPEQARGGAVDRRTDIFAMGIVLYKLTTGVHPFMGENDLVTMRNIIQRPLLPPRVKMPTYPVELEQVVLKCLQKDPDKRYQTMLELASALERALAAMGPADDDVGGFVRTLMGDRGAKRRAAIRDAIRTADERIATGTLPAVSATAPEPVVHENVSEIVLTQMATGVKEEILPDRMTVTEAPSGAITGSPTPGSGSMVSVELGSAPPRKSRSAVLLALGAGVAIGAVGLALVASRGGAQPAAPVEAHAAAQPTPAPTPAPAPTPSAVAEAKPAETATAVNIDDLPNVEKDKAEKDKGATRPTSVVTAAPTATATATAATKTAKPVSTQFVPTYKDPGF